MYIYACIEHVKKSYKQQINYNEKNTKEIKIIKIQQQQRAATKKRQRKTIGCVLAVYSGNMSTTKYTIIIYTLHLFEITITNRKNMKI